MTDLTALRTDISPFYDATHPTYGGVGDGITDDRSALFNANAAAFSSGVLQLLPGTYKVGSDLTISAALRMVRGAVLKPANGVTITLKGPIDAGPWQIFDFSLGGKVDLTDANIKVSEARWYGLVGDGVTDDAPNFANLVANVPNFHTVEFDQNLQIAAHSSLRFNHKTQVKFTTRNLRPQDAYFGEKIPSFIWKGGAGGTLMQMVDAGNCEVSGFFFDCQDAAVGLDVDQSVPNDPARICTENRVLRNKFSGGAGNKDIVLLRIAYQSPSNVEYLLVEDNYFGSASGPRARFYNGGQYAVNGTCTVTATGGNALITFGSNVLQEFINKGYTTVQFRCDGLGTSGKGTLLDTTLTIVSANSGTVATLPNASMSSQSPYFILDANDGIGVMISHQNSKRHILRHNHYNTLNIGINCQGGSFHAMEENFPDCDVNIFVPNSNAISEPCYDRGSNTEQSRVHLYVTSIQPYACEHLRCAPLPAPGAGFLIVGPQMTGTVTFYHTQIDTSLHYADTGSSLFHLVGNAVNIIGPTFPFDMTLEDIGLDNASIGRSTHVNLIGAGQSGGLAIKSFNQTLANYDPTIGRHGVMYSVDRSARVMFLPDLNADPLDMPLALSMLEDYSGMMWLDHSGSSSMLRIEERDYAGSPNTRYIYNTLRGIKPNYDPPNLASLTATTTTVTVTGAGIGDKCRAAFSLDQQGLIIHAFVSAADTVTVVLFNPSGVAVDLASGTLSVTVEKS